MSGPGQVESIERYGTNAVVGFSQATRAGDLIFLSGQVAVDERGVPYAVGDVAGQTRGIFERLERLLGDTGSGLDRVTKITVFTTDRGHIPTIRQVRQAVFERVARFPASTIAVVAGLAEPEYLVEIEAIALRHPHAP